MNPYIPENLLACVAEVYKTCKFDVAPRGNMLLVAPIDADKAGLQEPSRLSVYSQEGKIGFYLVLEVSPGYESPNREGSVTIPYRAGEIVLVEKKHVLTETFTTSKVEFVSANYVLGVATKRDM